MHIDWIDRWKGLLILLVVIGHAVGATFHVAPECVGWFYYRTYKLIYIFHMSAFFWLMGMCWRHKNDGFAAFVLNKAKRLLIPYFCFAILSMLVYALFAGAAQQMQEGAKTAYYAGSAWRGWWPTILSILHAGNWPVGRGFQCNSVLWFLPTMFTVSCAYWWFDRWVVRCRYQLLSVIAFAALACVCRMYTSNWPWGLNLAPWFLCFVIMGRWSGCVFTRISNVSVLCRRPFAWTGLILGWIAFGAFAVWLPDLWRAFAYVKWFCTFFIAAIIGICLSAGTARVVSIRGLAALGGASMGIMLMHKFVVLAMQLRVPLIRRWLAGEWYLSVIAVILIIVVSTALSYLGTLVIRRFAPWLLGERRTSHL